MEGFCGKICDDCTWREQLGCPGCQMGPGRPFSGDCGIAACCREKGHAACGTCLRFTSCGQRMGRGRMPEERQRRAQAEAQRRRELDQRAVLLGKWLWPLFWLVIPGVIANLMGIEAVSAAFPAVGTAGEVLNVLCNLAYGLLLWPLGKVLKRYQIAALCCMGVAGYNLLTVVFPAAEGNGLWWLLSFVLIVVGLYRDYQEYNAHADVLDGADDALAGKWRTLWKWNIGLILGLFGCVVLAMVSGVLGLLALLADLIGVIVVSILKLVYLYRTAKLFREHVPTEMGALPE